MPDYTQNPGSAYGAEDIFDIEKLSVEVKMKYRNIQSLLWEIDAGEDDLKLNNEWERLLEREI